MKNDGSNLGINRLLCRRGEGGVLRGDYESLTISLTEHGIYNAEKQIIGHLSSLVTRNYKHCKMIEMEGTSSMMGAQFLKLIHFGGTFQSRHIC